MLLLLSLKWSVPTFSQLRDGTMYLLRLTFSFVGVVSFVYRKCYGVVPGNLRSKKLQLHSLQGALSRIFSISLNSQNIYLCHRKPTNNGLFLLTISILVC